MIAVALPKHDALNLRLTCRSFLALYWSDLFWASRFTADSERGFLFEARDKRDAMELLSLYRATRYPLASAALRNRQRVWELSRLLIRIARQQFVNNTSCFHDQSHNSTKWIKITGDEQLVDLRDEWMPSDQGCRSGANVTLYVPQGLIKIGITTVSLGDSDYVTGIRLITRDEREDDQVAGYM